MRSTPLAVGAVLITLSTGVMAASKSQPVAVEVGPAVSFAPGNVRITSHVEPAVANRMLLLVVESDSHYSSSELPLEGDQAPRSHSFFLKNLPAGEYEVVATLRTESGTVKVVRQRFQVLENGASGQ